MKKVAIKAFAVTAALMFTTSAAYASNVKTCSNNGIKYGQYKKVEVNYNYNHGNGHGKDHENDKDKVKGKEKEKKKFVKTTAVSINKTSLTLKIGTWERLVATVQPTNATMKHVVWTSSNPKVAWVNLSGKVTARKQGEATIYAITLDGRGLKKASCKVTVVGNDSVTAATAVSLNKTAITIDRGQSETLVATVTPDNATDKSLKWGSSNANVATVSQNGVVTGKAEGMAIVYAYTNDWNKVAYCVVTVDSSVNQVPVTGVSLNKSNFTLSLGTVQRLVATVSPSDATNKSVVWSSGNTGIATVDQNGNVTGRRVGTTNIYVTTNDGYKVATSSVTVTSEAIPVTGISLNKTATSLSIGGTEHLQETISPSNATNQEGTWSSSNISIVSVDQSGNIRGEGAGTAYIYAITKDGSKVVSCQVTVNSAAVSSVSLNKSTLTLAYPGSETLVAAIYPSNAGNRSVTWSSSNTAVATVDSNGLVRAVAPGTAIITVTTADGGKTATCTVTVQTRVTGVTLNLVYSTITVGSIDTLKAQVAPSNAENKTVTWSSSNTSVATVDSNGVVRGINPGTATITVRTDDEAFTDTCQVTVLPAQQVPVNGIVLNKISSTIVQGATDKAVATVYPTDSQNQTLTWTTNNASVATVAQDGTVTGVNPGSAQITVTTSDNKVMSYTVIVVPQ